MRYFCLCYLSNETYIKYEDTAMISDRYVNQIAVVSVCALVVLLYKNNFIIS